MVVATADVTAAAAAASILLAPLYSVRVANVVVVVAATLLLLLRLLLPGSIVAESQVTVLCSPRRTAVLLVHCNIVVDSIA